MDSENEIPSSQHSKNEEKSTDERRRGKRKNLSLRSGKRKSTIVRSFDGAESSTSRTVNNLADEGSSHMNIYLYDDDNLESGQSQSIIPKNYDIYESAKILEQGNVPASQEEICAKRTAQKKFSATQELISARQLMQIEQNSAAAVGVSSSKYQLETQLPGISETQLTTVCNLADEVHLLIDNDFQLSGWLPEQKQKDDCATKAANRISSIAQAILNDFDIESDDDSIPKTPPRLILKKPNRKYGRKAGKCVNAIVSWDTDVAANNDVNESICDDDIDLNASFMIQKNMADLSVIFESQLQPQTINLMLDECVFERGSQSGDESLTLSGESSDECETTTTKQTNMASGFLSEDDDIFIDFTTPRIPSTVKRAKRNHESMTDEFVRPKTSTPSTSKSMNKGTSLHPKRLRFECDRDSMTTAESIPTIGFTNGFKASRGASVGISAEKLKKSAKLFDEIYADFDGLPVIEESVDALPGFLSLAGFKTTNTFDEHLPTIEASLEPVPSTSTAHRTDSLAKPFSSSEFKTANTTDVWLPRIGELAKFTPIPCMSAGFKTTRGQNIQEPSSTVLKKSMKLFEFEKDDVNFDLEASAKKHVRWQDEFDAPAMSNVNAFIGFKTAIGTSINVSADTFKRYAALFEEEVNENLLDQCEAEISVTNSICDDTVATSPFNQTIRTKFTTSTPNVAATAVVADRSSIEFLDQMDEQEESNLFGEFSTQWPQNSELKGTCLTDRFNHSDAESEYIPTIVSEHVKNGRKEALVRQQANCLRKNNIRPKSGCLRKQKSEQNKMALKELGTPKSYSCDELIRFGVATNVINVDIENVFAFKFEMWRYYSKDECMHNIDGIDLEDGIKLIMDDSSRVGFDELSSAFLDCDTVDPKLVPDNWIRNSLKWILLKLAAYERTFPQRFAGNGLTPANVILQLKYRYDREIDRSERSAIRKIVEQDDAASKPLVLFVSRIKRTNSVECSLEMSDGWYGIGTNILDPVLANAVQTGKIRVGTKLLIQDAELIGVEEACSPLEMPSSTALKFSANSTRRVKWHTKLGYFNYRRSLPFPMNSIQPHGGQVCKFVAFIVRIYPLLFVVKTEPTTNANDTNTNRTVIRSEKIQRRLDATENRKQFDIFETLYSQVSAEVEREYEAKWKESVALPKRKISEIDDAEELWLLMERSHDAESFENTLSCTQKTMVKTYREKINHEKQHEITLRVKEKFDEGSGGSKATPLLKLRIVDCDKPATSRSAILSIWNADECDFDLRENTFVEITCVNANGLRRKDLQLTANRRTKIRNIDTQLMTVAHITVQRKCYQLADINDASSFKPNFNEFDVVAYVLHIEPIADTKFQTVHFVDTMRNILHVKFWNGLKQYGFDDVIEEGKIVAIANLEWRPSNGKSPSGWPQAFVNDLTTITASSKSQAMIERSRQLTECFREISNGTAYIEECMSLIHSRRDFDNSSSILSASNSSPMNRTLNHSKIENSTKSRTKMKMDKLKVYKSPSSTPAMIVSHGTISTLRRPFKSPMATAISIQTANNNKNNNNQENET